MQEINHVLCSKNVTENRRGVHLLPVSWQMYLITEYFDGFYYFPYEQKQFLRNQQRFLTSIIFIGNW